MSEISQFSFLFHSQTRKLENLENLLQILTEVVTPDLTRQKKNELRQKLKGSNMFTKKNENFQDF